MRLRDFLEAAQALATDPDPPREILMHPETFRGLVRGVSGEFALKREPGGTWSAFGLPIYTHGGVRTDRLILWRAADHDGPELETKVEIRKREIDPREIARCFIHTECAEHAGIGRACWEARQEGDSWTR